MKCQDCGGTLTTAREHRNEMCEVCYDQTMATIINSDEAFEKFVRSHEEDELQRLSDLNLRK